LEHYQEDNVSSELSCCCVLLCVRAIALLFVSLAARLLNALGAAVQQFLH
jgi:hypothetical protein